MKLCAGRHWRCLATLLCSIALVLWSIKSAAPHRAPVALGLPAPDFIAAPEPQRKLGKALFFDRRLSFNNAMSCAMCHVPEEGFASSASRTSIGLEGRTLPRNAPTLLNVGYQTRLFHDGRESSLANQVWLPLLSPVEMGNPSIGYVLEKLASLPEYQKMAFAAFGTRDLTMEKIGLAIEAFERTLIAGGSRFDKWRFENLSNALAPIEKSGYALFVGKARCSTCHLIGDTSALFTDRRFYATGASLGAMEHHARLAARTPNARISLTDIELESFTREDTPDLGRYEVTHDAADRFEFKTPSLRNVERTAPYMHDGSIPTLEAVVEFYDRGGAEVPNKTELVRPLHLTLSERNALVAFLKTLTSPAADSLPRLLRAHD